LANDHEYRAVAKRLLDTLMKMTLHAPQSSDMHEIMSAKAAFEVLEKSVLCPGSRKIGKKVCSHCDADCGMGGMGGAVDHALK
jgi:hypothetical protein